MQTINADRVAEEIERGSVQLINVLNADDFTREHIPGSVNIPVSHPGFVERVEQTVGDKGTRVVVYCASRECPASENAARKLEEAGFSNVMDFEEGMQGWKDAGRRVSAGNDEIGRPTRNKLGGEPSRRAGEPQPRPDV